MHDDALCSVFTNDPIVSATDIKDDQWSEVRFQVRSQSATSLFHGHEDENGYGHRGRRGKRNHENGD